MSSLANAKLIMAHDLSVLNVSWFSEPDQLKDVNTGSLRTDQKGGNAVEE
jgi:hypothetical protein